MLSELWTAKGSVAALIDEPDALVDGTEGLGVVGAVAFWGLVVTDCWPDVVPRALAESAGGAGFFLLGR